MSCKICKCSNFRPNPYQKNKCSECLHDHNATPAQASSSASVISTPKSQIASNSSTSSFSSSSSSTTTAAAVKPSTSSTNASLVKPQTVTQSTVQPNSQKTPFVKSSSQSSFSTTTTSSSTTTPSNQSQTTTTASISSTKQSPSATSSSAVAKQPITSPAQTANSQSSNTPIPRPSDNRPPAASFSGTKSPPMVSSTLVQKPTPSTFSPTTQSNTMSRASSIDVSSEDAKAKSPGLLERGLSFVKNIGSSEPKEAEIEISGPINTQHVMRMEKSSDGRVRTTVVPKEIESLIQEVDASIKLMGDQNGVREEEKEFLIRTLIGETPEQRKSRKMTKRYSKAQWGPVDSSGAGGFSAAGPSSGHDNTSMRKSVLKSSASTTASSQPNASANQQNVKFQGPTQVKATSIQSPVNRPDAKMPSQLDIMRLIEQRDAEKDRREALEKQMQAQSEKMRQEMKEIERRAAEFKLKSEEADTKIKSLESKLAEVQVVGNAQAEIDKKTLLQQIQATEQTKSHVEATLKQVNTSLAEEKARRLQLESENQKLERTVSSLEQEKRTRASSLSKGDEELQKLRTEYSKEKEKLLQKIDMESQAKLDLERKILDKDRILQEKDEKLFSLDKQMTSTKQQVSDIQKQKDSEIAQLQKLLEAARKEATTVQEKLNQKSNLLQDSESKLKHDTQALKDRLDAQERKSKILEQENADLKKQIEELKSTSQRKTKRVTIMPDAQASQNYSVPPPPPPPPSANMATSRSHVSGQTPPAPPPPPPLISSPTSSQSGVEDPRELLLSAIRGEKKLRHVSVSIQNVGPKAALAKLHEKSSLNIIAKALLERRTNMKENSDSDDQESDSDEDWD
eukprot:TRINITY_DN5023_c0_g2_i2.p1 TRINITY_DN5023_c0_g2~~TRINITY_DN5023_c0_g2_i2.p1  ORF type:complete len:852 (-),score=222.34 TRINITY_DN5023_c0_g2_i2:72-2627(-)